MEAFPVPVVINLSRKVNMYCTSVYECFRQFIFSANSSNFIFLNFK